MVICNELNYIKIKSSDYINTETKIIQRYITIHNTTFSDWINKFAIKYYKAVKKLKKLDVELLEKEIYKQG